jgi:hypothetical protein
MLRVSRPIDARGIEGLRDADERHALAVEHLHQLGEVHERAGEPVDLVDDHDIDPAVLDVGEKPLQTRPLQRAAGPAAIVISVGDQCPAFRPLALDAGLARLTLGIERVEVLLQALVGRLARVDGAAQLLLP